MLEQKYALVSGASSGIGFEVAKTLTEYGYKVYGCTVESAIHRMKPIQESHGVIPFVCDISKPEQIKAAADYIGKETGGKLHFLYNNAGIGVGGPVMDIPDEWLEDAFRINVLGHIYMTKYMCDYVIAAAGKIVFTSSVAARVPLSWASVYCSTKAAIDQYAWVLRNEMRPLGVQVHSVITGGVNTAIVDNVVPDELPDSYFSGPKSVESMLCASGMSRNKKTTIEPSVYAKSLIKTLLKSRDVGFNVYKGAYAYILHFVGRYYPHRLTEWLIAFQFKQLGAFEEGAKVANERRKAKLL